MKMYECKVMWYNEESGHTLDNLVTFGENYTDVVSKIEKRYDSLLLSVHVVEASSNEFYVWDSNYNFNY